MTSAPVRAAHLPQTTPYGGELAGVAENAALLTMVAALSPTDWARPTDCTLWTVRDMVAHLAGAAEEASRAGVAIRRNIGGLLSQRRLGGLPVEHTCAMQIADRAHLSDSEVEADLRRWAPAAPRGRRHQPWPLRRMRFPRVVGFRPGVTGSYVFDVIYNRDTWLHRVDLARATDTALITSGAEDDVIAQVVRDLDLEWRAEPFVLTLTGVGGGTWQVGEGMPVAAVTEDSVNLMRLLSGRSDECTLTTEGQHSVAEDLRATRVVF